MDITYGVLNFNPFSDRVATAAFQKAVQSLDNNRSSNFKSEVYLIDQGGQGALVESMARAYDFRAITLDTNVGISRGVNLLARIARGQYICLVTSDTEFTKNLDVSLIDTLQSHSNVWQVCPASDISELEHQRVGYQSSGLAYTLASQELTIQIWPKETFEKIGYFDERWMACHENMDFSLRIFLAGGNIAVSHDAFCPHAHAMTRKSGARNHTYDNYIYMKDGFNQEILQAMWDRKWPLIRWGSLYEKPPDDHIRQRMIDAYRHNIYLPYLQDVGY